MCLEELYVIGFSLADTYLMLILNSEVVSSSLSKTEMKLPQQKQQRREEEDGVSAMGN